MIKFITDIQPDNETEILTEDVKHNELRLVDLDGNLIEVFTAPAWGWTDAVLTGCFNRHTIHG